jgi:hypothetical protein
MEFLEVALMHEIDSIFLLYEVVGRFFVILGLDLGDEALVLLAPGVKPLISSVMTFFK